MHKAWSAIELEWLGHVIDFVVLSLHILNTKIWGAHCTLHTPENININPPGALRFFIACAGAAAPADPLLAFGRPRLQVNPYKKVGTGSDLIGC